MSVYVCTYVRGVNLKVFESAWFSYPDFNEVCLREVLWVRVFKPAQWLYAPALSHQITPIKHRKNFGEVKGSIK